MRGKERAALRAGKAPRERGTFVRIIGEVDRPFLLIVIALLCIGSVMVFSASYAYGKYYFNDSYYFARRQLGWAVLGLAGMCFTAVVEMCIRDRKRAVCRSSRPAARSRSATSVRANSSLSAARKSSPCGKRRKHRFRSRSSFPPYC